MAAGVYTGAVMSFLSDRGPALARGLGGGGCLRFLVCLPAWAVWGAVFGWAAGTPGFLWPLDGWGGWPLWLALALPGTAWQLCRTVAWLGSGWGLQHRPEWRVAWARDGTAGEPVRVRWSWLRAGARSAGLAALLGGLAGMWFGGVWHEPPSAGGDPALSAAVRARTLELVNAARSEAGAAPVALGDMLVAQRQAEGLLRDCVLSHWGTDGLKPYMRYSLAGGYRVNGENVLTHGECGVRGGWIARHGDPLDEAAAAVRGFMASPGHRETILDPDYRVMHLGLAWDGRVFKMVQHFEGPAVVMAEPPGLRDGVLRASGELPGELAFREGGTFTAGLVYDPPPRALTRGQLARTSCYGGGELVAVVAGDALPGRDGRRYEGVVTEERCVDPYGVARSAAPAGSWGELARLNEQAEHRADRPVRAVVSAVLVRAREMRAEGLEFALEADVSGVLAEHGAGVYTVVLAAELEDGPEGEPVAFAEHSVFVGVAAPAGWREAR